MASEYTSIFPIAACHRYRYTHNTTAQPSTPLPFSPFGENKFK